MKKLTLTALCTVVLLSCNKDKNVSKKNQVDLTIEKEDSTSLKKRGITRPNTVIITGHPNHKLVTVYKEKVTKKGRRYIDGNYFYRSYYDSKLEGNSWHGNFMPGLTAIYGYKMYNITHYNVATKTKNNLFKKPVLVNTLYYPSESKDTLNFSPIKRDYYLVSVYDEDTNNDSVINKKDLRRLYKFDINGDNKELLLPKDYSVTSSEYDKLNDLMYIFARQDNNKNGRAEKTEPFHVFYFSLEKPVKSERLY